MKHALKEPHLNFYADLPPFELYLHMLRDEKRTLERFALHRDSSSPLLQVRKHLVEWTVELGDKLN